MHQRVLLSRAALCGLLGVVLLTSVACQRKPEDLEVWRPSKASNGLKKLKEWIADSGEPMPVRIRASEILIEEDYAYAVDASLKLAPEPDRKAIAKGLAPTLLEWYKAGDATVENYQTRKSKQVPAKEGLFYIHPYIEDAAVKEQIEATLTDWLGTDLHTRNQMGTIKANQIAELLGARASDPLLKALADPINNQAFLADILRKIKDPKVQAKTAETLAELGSKQLPKLEKEVETAVLTEEHEAIVPLLVKMVNNEDLDGGLRGSAHDRIAKVQGAKSLATYLGWVQNGPPDLRWLSVQAIGENQGKIGLAPLLKALPADGKYGTGEPDDLQREATRFCSADVAEMKAKTEPIFVKALGDAKVSGPGKALALACLQAVGTKANAQAAVEALKDDKTELPAWGKLKTLGELANETLGKLK